MRPLKMQRSDVPLYAVPPVAGTIKRGVAVGGVDCALEYLRHDCTIELPQVPSNFRGFQEWIFHDARKSPFPRMATATGDRRVASHPADAHRSIRNLRRSSCPASAGLLDDRGRRMRSADALRDRSSAWRRAGSQTGHALPRIALGSMLAAFPGAALIGLLEKIDAAQQCGLRSLSLVLVLRGRDRLSRRSSSTIANFGSRPPKLPVGSEPDAPDIRFLQPVASRDGAADHFAFDAGPLCESDDRPGLGHDPDPLFRRCQGTRRSSGRQVHRSHWVAAGQAKQILREKNRTMIELADGRRLPVSRPYFHDARKLVSEGSQDTT